MDGQTICFADSATQHDVEVQSNERIAQDTYRLRFVCPEIGRSATPGQFLMLRLAGVDDPLIGRPLALYDTVDSAEGMAVDVVYLVGGKMTRRLADYRSGQRLTVWGPLGNGFPAQPTRHLIMVAGGIGQTPFLALAKEHLGQRQYGGRQVPIVERVTFCYGARTAAFLAGIADFEAVGVNVRICTDDGTAGLHGQVTDGLRELLETQASDCRIVCCGPEPMMEAVAKLGASFDVPVQVSLETPMACGIGICFSCVAPVIGADGKVDYRRTCVEGPVFDARQIDWDH